MRTAVKGLCFFVAIILFLSITIKNKPIFTYIYQTISPVTVSGQNLAAAALNGTFKSTQNMTKKLFDNSVPKLKDSLKTKRSAPARSNGPAQEDIAPAEKEELDELIKTHR